MIRSGGLPRFVREFRSPSAESSSPQMIPFGTLMLRIWAAVKCKIHGSWMSLVISSSVRPSVKGRIHLRVSSAPAFPSNAVQSEPQDLARKRWSIHVHRVAMR